MITVRSLHVYPVKSLRGLSVGAAPVGDRGFVHDRRFMVVDGRGRFLTQRTLPRMSLVETSLAGPALRLSAPAAGTVEVALRPAEGEVVAVEVWNDRVEALAVDGAASRWLGEFLGVPCRLVHMPDTTLRATSAAWAPGRVGFADAFPFLVASTASLAELARRGADVPMERFRPNIVVDGAEPFAEDRWTGFRIGGVSFRMTKPCIRCSVTTFDPARGEVAGVEPLRTLATFRRVDDGVLFGMNAVHRGEGVIAVDDAVALEP